MKIVNDAIPYKKEQVTLKVTCAYNVIMNLQRRGFEPPVPEGTPEFQSGALSHSATSLSAKL